MRERPKEQPKAPRVLKLFVWTEFAPDYTGGLAVAIAENETRARKMIVKKLGVSPMDWGVLTIRPLDKRAAFAVAGGS